MTEYDYSPAAYQRHMETQHRIAKWVDNTEAHHDRFCVPFGPRSDVEDYDLEGISDAEEAIPSGASAGGWYEEKRRRGGRRTAPVPPPILHQPQPRAAVPIGYPQALASAPVGYGVYPSQGAYMSPPTSPPQAQPPIIIHSAAPRHHSHGHHHHSSHHHHHHHQRHLYDDDLKRSSSSQSHKSKKGSSSYILSPPGSAPPIAMPIQSSSYPQPPPGTFMYHPRSAFPGLYAPQNYSPPHSGASLHAPPPPSYYPQSAGAYMIHNNKAQPVRVVYV